MKKFFAILLALVMIMSLSTTAFADDATITIDDAAENTYNAYKLLNLTTSLKGDTHHKAHDGDHTDDCYNFAYTVNEKYRAILQAETFAYGRNDIWPGGLKPAAATAVTDDQILTYLSLQTSDSGDQFGSLRAVADRIYRAIQAAPISPDAANLTGESSAIAQGYWLIADVTNLSGENEANSLVMLDTNGLSSITIKPKTAVPTVEKKVKDIDDSEDSNILDNPWHDSADHDIGDTVPFKLTGTLPSNAQYYTEYTMIFHDTLSEGLDVKGNTVKVLMYETKHKADVDTDLNDYAKDVTNNFTFGMVHGGAFTISCEDVFAIEGVTKDTAFVVYYEATLNVNAVIGSAGNPNEVYLEYSNNPYGEGTGKTETDKVVVFTYQLTVNKVDSHGHELEGAGFTLYKKALGDKDFVAIGDELKGEALTTFKWKGLDDGDYKLVETTVPEGYNKMNDIVFSISAAHSETATNPELTSLDGGLMGMGSLEEGKLTGEIVKDIENKTGTVLPETGAQGTVMLLSFSSLVVVLAAVFMITRKKMSIYED